MSYDDPEGSISNDSEEDLYQAVIPQLSVKDIVASEPANPDPGDAYIIGDTGTNKTVSESGVVFNSANKETIRVPNSSPWNNWDGLSSFTVELYYKTSENGHDHVLFSTRDKPGVTQRVEGILKSNGNIQFILRDSSANRHSATVSFQQELLNGQAHLLTFRYDASGYLTKDALDVFVDGSAGTIESHVVDNSLKDVSNNKFHIGKPSLNHPGSQKMINYSDGSDVITVPDDSSIQFSQNFTVEFVWRQSASDSSRENLFDKSDLSGASNGGWAIQAPNTNGNVYFIIKTTNNGKINAFGGKLPDYNGEDIHIACMRKNDTLLVLIEGEVVGSTTGVSGSNVTTNFDLLIGNDTSNNDKIDEIKLWSEERFDEIKNNPYTSYDGTETNLEAYYKCNDDGTTGTLTDETANSNDGSISGASYVTVNNGSFSDGNRPGGVIREFRIWSEAISQDKIKEYKGKTIDGREENIAGYWPLTQKDIFNIYSDLSGYGNVYANENHGTSPDVSLASDGILLSSNKPSTYDRSESFEDDVSLPFLKEETNLETFKVDDTTFSKFNGSIDGEYAFGQPSPNGTNGDQDIIGRYAITTVNDNYSLINGEQIDLFSFYAVELDKNHDGGGFRLKNTDGTYEVGFAFNQPQWVFDDGTGNEEQIYSGDGTIRWIYVEMNFDWVNSEFGYYIEDQESGTIRQGTRSLTTGKNISQIEFWGYNNGWFDFDGKVKMWFDLVRVKKESGNFDGKNNRIAVYNGTSWQFYDPSIIKNPRAFVQSQDRIYRYFNGSWGEINVSGTGASSDSVIQRIESGSLPSNPSDGDAVIDARYSDIEWVRVYDGDTNEWKLEGTGNTIYRVDNKNFHWQEGDLDSGLNVTNDTLELDTV